MLLTSQLTADADPYADHGRNKQLYVERLTYGLPQTGDTTKPMTVPKGAEVLIETRFPYRIPPSADGFCTPPGFHPAMPY